MPATSKSNVAEKSPGPGPERDTSSTQEGVFKDFSVSQVVASALAAATSFALSAQLGIAGSIIGAAIGAAASAMASQVYRSVLKASAEKFKTLGEDANGLGGGAAAVGTDTPGTAVRDDANLTRTIQRCPATVSARARVSEVSPTGTPIAPTEVLSAARAREQARLRRRVTVVALATGMAAVLVFALVVSLATDGAGIGSQPPAQVPTTQAPAEQGPAEQPETDTDSKDSPAAPPASTDSEAGGTDDAGAEAGDTSSPAPDDSSSGGTSQTGDGSDSAGDATGSSDADAGVATSDEKDDATGGESSDSSASDAGSAGTDSGAAGPA